MPFRLASRKASTNIGGARKTRNPKPRILPTNPNRPVEHPCRFEFVVNVKTKNRLNGSFGNSRLAGIIAAGERKRERAAAIAATIAAGVPNLLAYQSASITMRRGSFGRGLDSDGLLSALKHVRDGIADALGFRDDSSGRLSWIGENAKASKGASWVAVTIDIECVDESPLFISNEGARL